MYIQKKKNITLYPLPENLSPLSDNLSNKTPMYVAFATITLSNVRSKINSPQKVEMPKRAKIK